MKLLAKNKRATYDYELTERLLAGLELSGAEVKSMKAGHTSLKGSFIALRDGEAFLTNAHVSPYEHASTKDQAEPLRNRRLLLHRRQLDSLVRSKQAGLSVVPTALFADRSWVKLEIGIGRGKKRYDKREAIKRRDVEREVNRSLKR